MRRRGQQRNRSRTQQRVGNPECALAELIRQPDGGGEFQNQPIKVGGGLLAQFNEVQQRAPAVMLAGEVLRLPLDLCEAMRLLKRGAKVFDALRHLGGFGAQFGAERLRAAASPLSRCVASA